MLRYILLLPQKFSMYSPVKEDIPELYEVTCHFLRKNSLGFLLSLFGTCNVGKEHES